MPPTGGVVVVVWAAGGAENGEFSNKLLRACPPMIVSPNEVMKKIAASTPVSLTKKLAPPELPKTV